MPDSAGTPARALFEASFKADVAALMGNLSASAVEIIDIRAGSVIVTFYVHAASAQAASSAVANLTVAVSGGAQTIAGTSVLSFGMVGGGVEGVACDAKVRSRPTAFAPPYQQRRIGPAS